jgi:diketogulonate reductase-like aldo/keto reductase
MMNDSQTVTLYSGERIARIGLGTWKMGGETTPDHFQNAKTLHALTSALEMGYTMIDTAEMYAGGNTETLIGLAIQGAERGNIFLTSKVWPDNLRYRDVLAAFDRSLKRLKTDYLDLYLVHWPNTNIPLEETFQAMNELLDQGRTRYIGVSNFDLELLRKADVLSGHRLAANQVPTACRIAAVPRTESCSTARIKKSF